MVRLTKHRDVDYILVDTSITVYHKDGTESVLPIQMQINIKKLPERSFGTLYRYVGSMLDRPFTVNKPKLEEKKGWFHNLFNK